MPKIISIILILFSFVRTDERTGCIEGNCYNGIGKYRYSNGDIYEGGFREKKKNGYVKYSFSNGDKFEGEYLKGIKHGKGMSIKWKIV